MIIKKILKNIFAQYSLSMVNYVENINNYSINIIKKKKCFLFFLKSQKTILLFFFILIIIKNLFSLIIFRKKFNNLNNIKKNFLFKILKKIKILKSEKSLELFNALISLNIINNEKLKKIKIQNNNFKEHYDCIVIGSGPAGSVTGLELINKKRDTIILEMGSNFDISNQKHPGDEFYTKWKNSGLSSTLGNTMLQYSSGVCLGGGSEINSGLYHNIDVNYLEKIYENKNNFEQYLDKSFFKKYLSDVREFQIENFQYFRNLYKYIENGAKKLNWEYKNLRKFSTIIDQKIEKNSMSKTFLKEYSKKGGKILENFEVKKIKLLKNNLIQITSKNKNNIIKFSCNNLFLCCGAPYTQEILKKNKLINKNINEYFHFHPMIKIISRFPEEVNSDQSIDVITTQITEFYPNFLFGNAASGKQFLKIATFGNKEAFNDVEKNHKKMTIFHSTFSGGETKIFNIPIMNEMVIFNNLNRNEKKCIYEAAKKLIIFLFESGASYLILCDEKNTKIEKKHLKYIDKVLKNLKFNISAVHLLGGLRMGTNKNSTLDIYGKIKNINHNIYVNDSSLLSYNLLKNPQSMIMQIAHINVKNFLNYKE